MHRAGLIGVLCLSPCAAALAQPAFSDSFEPAGADHAIWHKWPEADEIPFSDSTHNHTTAPNATWSARAEKADPWGYAMYADFGATAGAVYAEVWVYDPMDNDGLDRDKPVSNMLALIAGNPVGASGWNYTDYLQFGVAAWYDRNGLTDTYSIRTRHRDLAGGGFIDTGVPRKLGWTKLAIAVAAPADGGQARFYVDDQLVGVSYRSPGVSLQYVRLGLNFKSYSYFWYDDVTITGTLPGSPLRFDLDGDGDVDQEDFALFQMCRGVANTYVSSTCWRLDVDDNGTIDDNDQAAFEACASGPEVPADVACDHGFP